MKTGAIIYVAGGEPGVGLADDPGRLLRNHGVAADRCDIITRENGHFDIHDAWWQLMAKGMQQVLCIAAEVDRNGNIRLTGRQMRLCGLPVHVLTTGCRAPEALLNWAGRMRPTP